MEVCDRGGRLRDTVGLLERRGFAVECAQQDVSLEGDYLTFTPKALQLHYLYAVRPPSA